MGDDQQNVDSAPQTRLSSIDSLTDLASGMKAGPVDAERYVA